MIQENKSISAIVPFYNEEKYIKDSVNRLIKTEIFNQIILVNDSSQDGSRNIASELSEKHQSIILVDSSENKGKGNAINLAIPYLQTTHVVVHDADLEYFPEDIVEMFQAAIENPSALILGSRCIGNKERKNLYKITYYGNKILTKIFSILNNYSVTDIASCYWLIEVEKLKKLNIKEKGFSIEVEVLSKYLKLGHNIIEVPIKYEGRSYEDGKKINYLDGIKIFIKILLYSKFMSFFVKN
tara:strand:+ start:85 stop:807 length:723 start_codon:yes stop_codon:yes gene_type:complete